MTKISISKISISKKPFKSEGRRVSLDTNEFSFSVFSLKALDGASRKALEKQLEALVRKFKSLSLMSVSFHDTKRRPN